VSLSGETSDTPSFDDTFKTVTFGDTDDVDEIVFIKDGFDIDGLFEEADSEVDLLFDGSTIDLDFHEMGLFLSQLQLADLGVSQNADDGTVFLELVEVSIDGLGLVLGQIFEGVFGECLLL